MITQVEITTPRVSTSPIPFADGTEATDPIYIRSIDGLGPAVSTVNTSQYGSFAGEFFVGVHGSKRNIVMTLGFHPNWDDLTYETLRGFLYMYLMPGNQVTLRFTSTHMEVVEITGYVESFDPNIFTKDPFVAISIVCPQPDFIAVAASVAATTTQALPDGVPMDIEYQGTVPTGFVVEVAQAGALTLVDGEIRMINEAPDLDLFIMTGDVDATQFIRISSVQGSKFAQQVPIPSGNPTNVLGDVQVGSVWMQLNQGTNNFRIMSDTVGLTATLQYYARYGGI